MYSSNFTALHQTSSAERCVKLANLSHHNVVLAMVRQWLAAIGDNADPESKTKTVGFVLWEMMSSGHPIAAITEMLAIMESSQIEASRAVLQRLAKMILDDASSRLSSPEAIKSSLEFWKTHSTAVQNSAYLMYVLIQQCLQRVRTCEVLLKSLSRPGFNSLNQHFFEHYLKALCLGHFDEVGKQHAILKLGKRFPKNTPIAIALRDAIAQQM